jgi:hypothetical protein
MRRVVVLCTVTLTVLALAIPAVAQPVNDDLAAATGVTGVPFQDVVDTTEATTEPGEPIEGIEFCPPRGSTVWYALTLEQSQQVRIDTAGSDYDTTLAVYTGTETSDLSLVDCNDDTFVSLQAALTITADAGVTYLIQAGSFGGDGGGELLISIDEPGRVTGKPIIFRSKFKGLIADAFVEEFDETTGTFSSTFATLSDGQFSSGGKPFRVAELFVGEFTETVDEANETFTFTDWFGFVELGRDQYEIDKKLGSASVLADVVLQGVTCTGGFEDEELECTDLGIAEVTVDLAWDGVGGIEKSRFMEKVTFDGARLMFRGALTSREANVSGGWSGDRTADMSEAFGSLSQAKDSSFELFRGPGLP